MLETASGGTAILSGTLVNSGTLLASGSGSLVEIRAAPWSTAASSRSATASSKCSPAAAQMSPSSRPAAAGSKSPTRGHAEHFHRRGVRVRRGQSYQPQAVHRPRLGHLRRGQITSSYVSAAGNTSGTLFVSSGGDVVASINMSAPTRRANFHVTSGSGGTVEIVDPTVPNGGSVEPGSAPTFPQQWHRSAEHRLRRADDARLLREQHRHRRHADGHRRPPRRHHRASRQLHGRELRHRGRRPRRHAHHGGGASGEPVSH